MGDHLVDDFVVEMRAEGYMLVLVEVEFDIAVADVGIGRMKMGAMEEVACILGFAGLGVDVSSPKLLGLEAKLGMAILDGIEQQALVVEALKVEEIDDNSLEEVHRVLMVVERIQNHFQISYLVAPRVAEEDRDLKYHR